jgi:hypothetical protein
MITRTAPTNADLVAKELVVGDLLYDPVKSGTHGSRVEVQWTGHYDRRQRTYVSGIEETSGNPVQLAYDDGEKVKVWRDE